MLIGKGGSINIACMYIQCIVDAQVLTPFSHKLIMCFHKVLESGTVL